VGYLTPLITNYLPNARSDGKRMVFLMQLGVLYNKVGHKGFLDTISQQLYQKLERRVK
jgi:hypothetical protein